MDNCPQLPHGHIIVSKPHIWEDRPLDSEMIHFQFLISLFIFYFIAVVVSYVGKRLFI